MLTKNKVAEQDLPEVMKKTELDLNMTRYIHGKEWDAKFLEALVSERMKPLITKNCPEMQIGGM